MVRRDTRRKRAAAVLFAGCGLLAIAGPAAAQSCKDAGQLFYLGNTRGDAQSIWLSQTAEAGNFRLEAAQQNRLVDRWSRERQSLRLSLSDTVSNGSGGTHRLFIEPAQRGNGKDCLIDTHNQKVDFTLPPAFQRPPQKPDQTLPLAPERPPPPPVTGLMPTRPPGTPDQTLPTLPPSGVMPTRPPGTPDQTLPTIPPLGVMPERPSRPPAGVTPGVPVAPDLPDRPLAPVVPGAPELPDRRPYGPVAPQVEDRYGATERADVHDRTCRSDPEGSYPDDADWRRDCRPGQPLTEGRRYLEPTDWDIWSDLRITAVEKGGNSKLVDGETLTASFGIDNRVAENLVLGVSGMFSDGSTDSYGGLLKSGTSGFSFGPYLAWLVAEHVTFDLSASWGRVDNDIQLFDLATSFTTDVLSLSSDITFDTMVDGVALRPKVGVS